ncbi:GTPase domain-containing protein [Aggregatilinea lenta]|uniref:GTPase domain-containing protein n=1 Tax=Aggregatilinea lenta TaxID=913108 RepID=UPI000E5BEF13|nr:GTPase domain-containing protein [Aggregatilinea lenta]
MFDAFSREAEEALQRMQARWNGSDGAPVRVEGRIAIVGLQGSGKKTLCNSLWGWQALGDDLPDEVIRPLGLFTLVTIPDNTHDESSVLYHLESADLVIYIVDGTAGTRSQDVHWIARLRALPAAMLIVVNKTNLMPEPPTHDMLADMQAQFARPAIQLDAQDTNSVHEHLLPQILKLCPALAIPLATEITGLRWNVVKQLIRESMIKSGLITLENGATIDVRSLLDLQRCLVQNIARVYGYPSPDGVEQEGVGAIAYRFALDALTQRLAHLDPFVRGLVASLIGVSGTWIVGRNTRTRHTDRPFFPLFDRLFRRGRNHAAARDGR